MRTGLQRSFVYFLIFIGIGLDAALIGPALPGLAGQTGSSIAAMGAVFFLSAGGVTLGTLLGGWLFDWAPGRRLLVAGQVIVAALVFLVPHIPWFAALMVLFVLKGVVGGVVHTGTNTLMLWTHGEKSGPFVTALHFFFGLGAFLSPFVLGLLIAGGGSYPDAFHLLALFDLLVAAFLVAFLRPPAPVRKAPPTAATAVRERFTAPLVASALLFLFFYVSAEITFGGWIYTYAVTLDIADAVRAAYLTSIFWLTFTVGRLIAIPVAARVPPARTIPVALLGCAAFLGLLIIFPHAPAVVWITAAGAGFCMAPVWPSGFTLAGQSLTLTARTSGTILLGDSLGGMILPGLTGWIMQQFGAPVMPQWVLLGIAATFLAYLGILVFRARIRRENPAP
jgi:MFS transporter, FHS family, Na+ dependent glucose transporter 1